MQNGTDKRKKKLAPVVVAVGIIAFLILYVGAPVVVLWSYGAEALPVLAMLAPMVLAGTAVVLGIVTVLFQRLREIDKGEEDEAKKY